MEFLCTRAWLPTSTLWYFQPRDEHFDNGGWYIEHNKHGQRGDRSSSFYQKYKPREGFHSARHKPSSDDVNTAVSDAKNEDMSEFTTSSPSDASSSSSSSSLSSSTSPKEATNTHGEGLSSPSEGSQPHQRHDTESMINNSTHQTYDNINPLHTKKTNPSSTDDNLIHIDPQNKKSPLEELPCLHHYVCIFTCAFTTLQKLKTNHLYP